MTTDDRASADDLTLDPELAMEAKSIVALAFRNGPIEDVHYGKKCPHCAGKPEYEHITQDEMRSIMKNAVNRVYALLRLKKEDPDSYARQITFGELCTAEWDDPESV